MKKLAAIGPLLGGVILPLIFMTTIDNQKGILYHGIEAVVFSVICITILVFGES